jgi:hypothetical protein
MQTYKTRNLTCFANVNDITKGLKIPVIRYDISLYR